MVGAGNSSQSIEGVSGWIAAAGGDSIMHLFCTHTLLLTYAAASVGACIHRRGCDFTLTGRQVWVTPEDYRNAQCRSEIIHIKSFFVHPQLILPLRSM